MCIAASNPKSSLKPAIFRVQGRSRSSILVPPERSLAVLVMIRSNLSLSATVLTLDEPIAVKWRLFMGCTLVWRPRSRGIPSPSGTKICHKKTRVLAVAHSEDFMILSYVVLTQYSSVTDRQTDGRTDGRLCRSKHALSITCCRA